MAEDMQTIQQALEDAIQVNPFTRTAVVEGDRVLSPSEYDEDRPEERRRALLARAGVPRRYAGKVTPNHRYDEVLDAGDGLYIVGLRGVGKTHIAWEIALGYLEHHMHFNGYNYSFSRKVRVITANDLFEEIKATFDGEGSAAAVLDGYSKCDLLVLDDLGKEVPTPWVRAKLFQLVNRRYNDCKATIVTSQYDLDRFTARMGRGGGEDDAAAIRSRLIEMCMQIVMKGSDRRLALAPNGASAASAAQVRQTNAPNAEPTQED